MVHGAGKLGVGERDSPERGASQDLTRGGLATFAEEEARLRRKIRVAPAVEDDARNVAARLEARGLKHLG